MDAIGAKDRVDALLISEMKEANSAAAYPCRICGRETLEHVPPGLRICAMPLCRYVQTEQPSATETP